MPILILAISRLGNFSSIGNSSREIAGSTVAKRKKAFFSANFCLQMFVLLEMTISHHGDVRSAFSSCQAKVQDSHL